MSEYFLRRQRPVTKPVTVVDAKALLAWAQTVAATAQPSEVYRHKEGRTTLHFEYESRSYFLKLHRGVGWAEIFKNLLQARLPVLSASNEYRAVQILRDIGVDTLSVAAYARRGRNPASVSSMVVSDDLVGTISLEHYCEDWAVSPPPAAIRMRLIRKLAGAARRMHGAGINHRDFYLCHFHLHPDSLVEPQLRCHLIDLHRAQLRKRTPRRWRIKDLAGLYFSAMDCGLTRRDLLRFMHHYSDGGLSAALGPDASLWRQVARKADALYRKKAAAEAAPGVHAVRVLRGQRWAAQLQARVAQAPTDLRQWLDQHSQLLKRDRWSQVGLLELQGQPCFIKLYQAKSLPQRLGFRSGHGRAVRSFDAAQAMANAGLPVPAARACLALPGIMILLTEGLAGGRDLRALWQGAPEATQATQWLAAAGELLARLHLAGFAHGDCKWSNLLWSGEQFYLVDLEAVRQVGEPLRAASRIHPRQARDLARFTVDAERLALAPALYQLFLGSYLSRSGLSREQVTRQVLPLAEKIRARHRRKYDIVVQPLID